MKQIDKDELYQNLSSFLKSKGIELQDGSYANRIRHGCGLLTDAVNATQKTVKRAKVEVDKKLDQLRQSIHDATAPEPAASPVPGPPPARKVNRRKGKARRKTSATRSKARRKV
jgi:hypothetical protein